MTIIFVIFYGNGYGITILRIAPSPEKYYAIQVKQFTSRKDTVHNLVYSCAQKMAQVGLKPWPFTLQEIKLPAELAGQ